MDIHKESLLILPLQTESVPSITIKEDISVKNVMLPTKKVTLLLIHPKA